MASLTRVMPAAARRGLALRRMVASTTQPMLRARLSHGCHCHCHQCHTGGRQMSTAALSSAAPAPDLLSNIDLMVCDMAGTTVEEGGVVYKTLRRVMVDAGLDVSEAAMEPWHGAKKEAVIEHFAREAGWSGADLEPLVMRISDNFVGAIEGAYFSESATIAPIDDALMEYLQRLKAAGVKVGLDTGYPQNIQNGLVKKLGFDDVVDGYVSAYDVREGRPYPYMIYHLMERLGVENVRRVAKVGDSVRDIEEGKNAGCGLVVGVLSGADSAEALYAAGADIVVDVVTQLPVPH